MQYLTNDNAQKMVDKIMGIVPYNINIMDKYGVIIASGDKARIGTSHKGAVKALEMREAYIVYKDTETEKKGINLPIFFNFEIEGVIGVSGDVDEVMQIGQIVATTAQLMIENEIYNNISSIRESRMNDFFHEWIQRKREEYSARFLEQAEYLHVDLKKERIAVEIITKRVRFSVIEQIKRLLDEEDYIVRQGMNSVMLLLVADSKLERKLNMIMNISPDLNQCYIGEENDVAALAVKSTEKTRYVAQILKKTERIIHYEEIQLECLLCGVEDDCRLNKLKQIFSQHDEDDHLRSTIMVYAQMNDNHEEVCKALYIHRNTLNYRLNKINELTGLNPRKGKDLMVLYLTALKMMLDEQAYE